MADFYSDMKKILKNYSADINKAFDESVEEVAKDTVRELKQTSPKGKNGGQYANSWKYSKDAKRLKTTCVIYNAKHYQLTHLLEYGHAIVKGGRTVGRVKAYPHIAKAEEKAIENLEKKVEAKINDII